MQAAVINRKFAVGLGRAYAGAIIFSLPLLMTMEMWWLGFYADRLRLAIFVAITVPLLIGLSHYSGFETTASWKDDVVDAFVGCFVGITAAAGVLALLALLGPGMSFGEMLGKISLQAMPGAMGAVLAQSQLGAAAGEENTALKQPTYRGELFLMAVGALFLALNLAPTEEMVLIAFQMTDWHALLLVVVSLVIMHAFVYAVEFQGQAEHVSGASLWSVFLRYTAAGYGVVLLITAYVLWTFGRLDGLGTEPAVMAIVVLAFPAAIGAAAARLLI